MSSIEDLVMVDDKLRPQSTTGYHRAWQAEPFDFPNEYITAPFPVKTDDPISTYAMDRNLRFSQRYSNTKNVV
jgi:hypothetical protein